jgi:hypothetical protein
LSIRRTNDPGSPQWAHVRFGALLVGVLVVLGLGSRTRVVYTLAGILLQLVGGTIFAVGFLGDGMETLKRWLKQYLHFSQEPLVSLAPMYIMVNLLLLLFDDGNGIGRRVTDFAATGATVVLVLTAFARALDLRRFVEAKHVRSVRAVCGILGASMYWWGTRLV